MAEVYLAIPDDASKFGMTCAEVRYITPVERVQTHSLGEF